MDDEVWALDYFPENILIDILSYLGVREGGPGGKVKTHGRRARCVTGVPVLCCCCCCLFNSPHQVTLSIVVARVVRLLRFVTVCVCVFCCCFGCRVCKRWRRLVKDQRLWRLVDLTAWKGVRMPTSGVWLDRLCSLVQHFTYTTLTYHGPCLSVSMMCGMITGPGWQQLMKSPPPPLRWMAVDPGAYPGFRLTVRSFILLFGVVLKGTLVAFVQFIDPVVTLTNVVVIITPWMTHFPTMST